MNTFDASLLRRSARRAYERGRLTSAAERGAVAVALALPGYLACGRTPVAGACLAAFALLVGAARFCGGAFENGARAGVIAGVLPCLLPAVLRIVSPDLCDTLFARGPWLCGIDGAAAGVVLGLQFRPRQGWRFWATAAATLALAATLGCIPAGAMGFAGLLAGVVAGGAPVLAARRAAA